MHIKYRPKNDPPRKQTTNLGIFEPDQVGGPYVSERDKRWARLLVSNGEFVETDPSGVEVGETLDIEQSGEVQTSALSKSGRAAKKSGRAAKK